MEPLKDPKNDRTVRYIRPPPPEPLSPYLLYNDNERRMLIVIARIIQHT